MSTKVNASTYQQVEALLGRPPRGLRSVPVISDTGEPVVIQVASIVDNKPFPTLFWLVDKRLNYAIDQLEAQGMIACFQEVIDNDESLQQALVVDHQAYIELRANVMTASERTALHVQGFGKVLSKRGIGGIANFTRIRCLHTYYAAHLVLPNTVGQLLDQYWLEKGMVFEHGSFTTQN